MNSETQSKQDSMTILYDNIEVMSSLRTSEELWSYLSKSAIDISGADVAAVFLADFDEKVLSAVGGYNHHMEGHAGAVVPMSMDDFCGSIALTCNEQSTKDIKQISPRVLSMMGGLKARTIIGLPIYTAGRLIGVLLLASQKRSISKTSSRMVQTLCGLAAVSYERVRLLGELDKELAELKNAATITDKVHLEEGHEKVVSAVLEAGERLLDADAIALYLLDDNNKKLKCIAAHNLPINVVEPRTADQQKTLVSALSEDIKVIDDLRALPTTDPLHGLVLEISVRGMLGLPLKYGEQPMGMLAAFYRRPNGAGSCRKDLCRMLALDAAVALKYSSILDRSQSLVRELEIANVQLEQQAVQDGLTGLSNHRSFQQRLMENVHRVGRYGEMFTVAMLDVDHFKAYNDAYGHQEGDFALKTIAQIIAGCLRESDVCARYGGEEFAAILPNTNRAGARIALERIRKAIDSYSFPNGKLTISAGIAECPTDGVMPNEVLEKADRALYHAKLTGRNRVCIWGASQEVKNDTESSTEGKTVSVLVVENDLEGRKAMEHALALAGYELHRAGSTAEAIGMLRSRKFDVMLSDSLILGSEGMQMLGLASSIHPMMPIVLTTAPSLATEAREAMKFGVTDLLMKPFNENELPIVIERNLERKRLERQMLLQKSTGILLQAIDALVAAIDAKDRLTAGHTTRVTHIALAIADVLGLSSEDRYTLELGARLHDIGKISLPDSALNKPGLLNDEEWSAMRRHPAVGSQIVGSIEELSYVATIVRHHHERIDGNGYPDGLAGEAIPLLSRIITVADAFEAMTSNRAFRDSKTTEEAIEELRRCIGTHYSSEIVDALVEGINSGLLEDDVDDQAA